MPISVAGKTPGLRAIRDDERRQCPRTCQQCQFESFRVLSQQCGLSILLSLSL